MTTKVDVATDDEGGRAEASSTTGFYIPNVMDSTGTAVGRNGYFRTYAQGAIIGIPVYPGMAAGQTFTILGTSVSSNRTVHLYTDRTTGGEYFTVSLPGSTFVNFKNAHGERIEIRFATEFGVSPAFLCYLSDPGPGIPLEGVN